MLTFDGFQWSRSSRPAPGRHDAANGGQLSDGAQQPVNRGGDPSRDLDGRALQSSEKEKGHHDPERTYSESDESPECDGLHCVSAVSLLDTDRERYEAFRAAVSSRYSSMYAV